MQQKFMAYNNTKYPIFYTISMKFDSTKERALAAREKRVLSSSVSIFIFTLFRGRPLSGLWITIEQQQKKSEFFC